MSLIEATSISCLLAAAVAILYAAVTFADVFNPVDRLGVFRIVFAAVFAIDRVRFAFVWRDINEGNFDHFASAIGLNPPTVIAINLTFTGLLIYGFVVRGRSA